MVATALTEEGNRSRQVDACLQSRAARSCRGFRDRSQWPAGYGLSMTVSERVREHLSGGHDHWVLSVVEARHHGRRGGVAGGCDVAGRGGRTGALSFALGRWRRRPRRTTRGRSCAIWRTRWRWAVTAWPSDRAGRAGTVRPGRVGSDGVAVDRHPGQGCGQGARGGGRGPRSGHWPVTTPPITRSARSSR
jgi:hypothetical protein